MAPRFLRIRSEHLQQAERRGLIPADSAAALWADLRHQLDETPTFGLQHVFYYMGALLMLLPLTVLAGLWIVAIGAPGVLVLAPLVGTAAWLVAEQLERAGRRIASGIFGCLAIAMAPAAVWALLALTGSPTGGSLRDFHRVIDARWLVMEAATLIVSAALLARLRQPFMVLPVAVTLWYIGLDLTAGASTGVSYRTQSLYTLAYGAALLGLAWHVQRRQSVPERDFAYWLWMFGALTFWHALALVCWPPTGWRYALYGVVNLAMVITGALVQRRVLTVLGALGAISYLGYLSLQVFGNRIAFPLVMLLLGSVVIVLALRWPSIEAALRAQLVRRAQPSGGAPDPA